ncbi:hypothetical protein SORBI_3001G457966 [Sorghum bicolor]|uniref:Uncharacterized protein n=1 Tax=Sorghum bicolor TaxID=4558 RepID=A0A1Z5SAX9_SORBI|nr:hypothetical protein SORBI_3001G457966 [Sorghum bicolor]
MDKQRYYSPRSSRHLRKVQKREKMAGAMTHDVTRLSIPVHFVDLLHSRVSIFNALARATERQASRKKRKKKGLPASSSTLDYTHTCRCEMRSPVFFPPTGWERRAYVGD